MHRALAYFIAVFGLVMGSLAPAHAAKRVALVIGNSAYQHTAKLANPEYDARDIAAALARLGFDVIMGLDLDYSGMRDHARRFSEKLSGANLGLFYYAGHGLQVGGRNYLVPVDARLKSERDLDFDTMRLQMILRQMEREVPTSIVFLDACRNNPMARNLARSMGTRSISVGRGLARVETGVGTLIAFATQPGNVALDGEGRNSPFTAALLKTIEQPGLNLGDVMIEVRKQVLKMTGGKQVPWEHSSLTGQVYFASPPVPLTAASTAGEAGRKDDGSSLEITFWQSIREGRNPRLFESYLNRYPEGTFADLARLMIEGLAQPSQRKKAAAPDDGNPVENAESLRELQDLLYELNYDPGRIDGVLGKTTRSAIRDFQKQAGVNPNGAATLGLLRRLRSLGGLKPWAVIVYSENRRDWGIAWAHTTRKAAIEEARNSCGGAKPCEVELSFFGTECGAFAYAEKSWAIAARTNLEKAKQAALDDCKRQGGDCRIIATVCADGAGKQIAKQ